MMSMCVMCSSILEVIDKQNNVLYDDGGGDGQM